MRALSTLLCVCLLLAPIGAFAQPKMDIKGVRPGMRLGDVEGLIKANNWFCVTGIMFGPGWNCRLESNVLHISKYQALDVAGTVYFRFASGGSAADILANVEATYAIKLKRNHQDDPSQLMFSADLGNDLVLELSNMYHLRGAYVSPEDTVWGLMLKNPVLDSAEQKALSAKRLQEKPLPKF